MCATRRLLFFPAMVILAVTAEAWAQSKDMENPTPLTTNTIRGDLPPNSAGNHYYAFRAGPGEVTATTTVEASGFGSVQTQLLASNLTSLCSSSTFVSSGVVTQTCSASLKGEQRVIMRVNLADGCKGCSYRIRIDGMRGAAAAAEPSPAPAAAGAATQLPAPGAGSGFRTMLIRLKDGTTMQIDLAKIADITYK